MKKKTWQLLSVLLLSCAVTACATTNTNKQANNGETYSAAVQVNNNTTNSTVATSNKSASVKKTSVSKNRYSRKSSTRLVEVTAPQPRGKSLSGTKAVRWANYQAQRQPNSYGYSNSIMTYNFVPGALYQIYCAPFDVTDIEFQPGEKITSVAAGDTLRWQVSSTYSGSGSHYQQHLLIKPTQPNLLNSLVVTTDQRTYHMQLHSTKDTYMAVVKWRYPGSGFIKKVQQAKSQQQMLQDLNLSSLNFNYRITLVEGPRPAWMPTAVFSDGGKTYIQFPEGMQESPLLFVGHSPDSDRIVNYRVEGSYFVVDEIISEAQLRLGQGPGQVSVVQITRNS